MERVFYSAESLRTALAAFEQEYATSSPKFYAAYLAGERLPAPHFEQHVWASFYEDVLRMEGKWVSLNSERRELRDEHPRTVGGL
jgi:hypothetical protein